MTTQRGPAQLVSVIIPVWNGEAWIADAIRSSLGQTWDHIEVVVVDDGSSDRTCAIVEEVEDSRLRIFRLERSGASAARNVGVRESRGELIQYLDADDILGQEKLELQVKALAAAPPMSIASCAWARFEGGIETARVYAEPVWTVADPVEWLVRSLSGEGMMQPGAWLVPRALVDAAGPWNESLSLHDDGEYFARVLTHSKRNVFVDGAIVYYRDVAGSMSRRRSRAAIESAYAVCRSRHRTLIAARDDAAVHRALATQYAQFAYEFGASAPDLASAALAEIKALGAAPADSIGGGSFRRAARIVGFDRALRLRSRIRD